MHSPTCLSSRLNVEALRQSRLNALACGSYLQGEEEEEGAISIAGACRAKPVMWVAVEVRGEEGGRNSMSLWLPCGLLSLLSQLLQL